MNQKVLDSFISERGIALEILNKITAHITHHCNISPEDINYSHDGSIHYVNEQLSNIMEFLGIDN